MKKTIFAIVGTVAVMAIILGVVIFLTSNKAFTVSFDSNGGTAVATQKVKKGEKATKPENPTKDNFTFVEWTLDGVAYDFNQTVKSNIKLYAKWLEVEESVTIKFDTDGALEIPDIVIKKGETITIPEDPQKENYRFVGWYLNDNKVDETTTFEEDVTLIAHWEEVPEYTIKFDSNGGSNVASQKVREGKLVAKPTDPTRNNYVFYEWQLNNKKYDFDTPVTQDITLKATWKNYVKYKKMNSIMGMFCSYEGTFKNASDLVVGDKIYCATSFEVYADDAVKDLTFDIEIGSGLTLLKTDINSKGTKNGNSYHMTYGNGTGVSENDVVLHLEVNSYEGLYIDVKNVKFITKNDDYYYADHKKTTLNSIWDKNATFQTYSEDILSLHCMRVNPKTGKEEYPEVLNLQVQYGDILHCYPEFESYSTDPVKSLRYEIETGSGLRFKGFKKMNNSFFEVSNFKGSLNYPNGTSVGMESGYLEFEVINSNNLYVKLKNVKFITTDDRHYTTGNTQRNFTEIWSGLSDSDFTYYGHDVVGFANQFYYRNGRDFQLAKNVKVGDIIWACPEFETYASDSVKSMKFTLTVGSGLKLLETEGNHKYTNGNDYYFYFQPPTGYSSLTYFKFEVVSTTNAYVNISNIKMITTTGNYYSNEEYNTVPFN